MLYDILVSNGFSYDYLLTLSAPSAHAARKEFKRVYAGHHYTEDFKVRKSQ